MGKIDEWFSDEERAAAAKSEDEAEIGRECQAAFNEVLFAAKGLHGRNAPGLGLPFAYRMGPATLSLGNTHAAFNPFKGGDSHFLIEFKQRSEFAADWDVEAVLVRGGPKNLISWRVNPTKQPVDTEELVIRVAKLLIDKEQKAQADLDLLDELEGSAEFE
jgi:hypothetical protein